MEVEVKVIQDAASAAGTAKSAAARPKAAVLIPPMFVPIFVVETESSRGVKALGRASKEV
jgi:hypothetical protein